MHNGFLDRVEHGHETSHVDAGYSESKVRTEMRDLFAWHVNTFTTVNITSSHIPQEFIVVAVVGKQQVVHLPPRPST